MLFSHSVMSNFWNPTDCSPPGSSVHRTPQARVLEWVAIAFSRGSSWPGIKPTSPALTGGFFTTGPPGKTRERIVELKLRPDKPSVGKWKNKSHSDPLIQKHKGLGKPIRSGKACMWKNDFPNLKLKAMKKHCRLKEVMWRQFLWIMAVWKCIKHLIHEAGQNENNFKKLLEW